MSLFRRKLLESYATNKLVYPGLIAAWSAKGKTNEDADRNVLKDLTGNGHDITLNNFAYSGMSGYGGYMFTKINIDQPLENYERINLYKIRFKKMVTSSYLISFDKITTPIVKSFKFKVTGITNQILHYGYNREPSNDIIIDKDGIYTTKEVVNPLWYGIYATGVYNDVNITIELLPEYPDALVFDGVDDYGVNKSIKDVLNGCEEYTVIAKRKYIDLTKNHWPVFSITNIDSTINTLFLFEFYDGVYKTFNKSSLTNNLTFPDVISWQTPNSYNQRLINKGSNTIVTGFVIGRYGRDTQYVAVALYSYYIFNRTLPDQEIKSFIRKHIDPEYLLPSEIVPTPPLPTR